ncbi:hypothetical protein NC652_019332 [Populus alba x Populus x berolinensis]|nr:hypothetical protein NC652_019332 [Populus alba x Populus x berolinensis]
MRWRPVCWLADSGASVSPYPRRSGAMQRWPREEDGEEGVAMNTKVQGTLARRGLLDLSLLMLRAGCGYSHVLYLLHCPFRVSVSGGSGG